MSCVTCNPSKVWSAPSVAEGAREGARTEGCLTWARPLAKNRPAMASNTRVTWKRRVRRHTNMGKKRKAKESRKSTLSAAELFAGMGEPGK